MKVATESDVPARQDVHISPEKNNQGTEIPFATEQSLRDNMTREQLEKMLKVSKHERPPV